MRRKTSARSTSKRSRQIDVREIAAAYGISMSDLARMLGLTESALGKSSTTASLQPALQGLVRINKNLGIIMPADAIGKWMTHPLRSVGGLTAIELAEQHGLDSLEQLVQEMCAGGYS